MIALAHKGRFLLVIPSFDLLIFDSVPYLRFEFLMNCCFPMKSFGFCAKDLIRMCVAFAFKGFLCALDCSGMSKAE